MPIRLNLLAEIQGAEELRRRDPVKRFIWVGALLVSGVLVWASSLQLKAMLARGEVSQLEAEMARRTNDFQQVMNHQRRSAEITDKLARLRQLATNRFLHGTLLNALQQTVLPDVQLMRIKVEQKCVFTEEGKGKTNSATGRVTPGKPATAAEKILVTLDGRDSSPNPGDQAIKYKDAINANPYFLTILGKTNEAKLTNLSPPQTVPDSRPFVSFTLECRYPERVR